MKNFNIGRVVGVKLTPYTKIKEDLKMGLRIQNNIAALNTHRNLVNADRGLSRSLERLSSGFRINKASDDSAGLAISMRFRAQIKALTQGANNASQAQSLLQVAEGAADQVTNILQRMKELATQAASDSTPGSDRTKINNEITDLESEIDRIVNSTKYAGSTLIDGSFGSTAISDGEAGNLTAGSFQISSVDVSGATAASSYTVTITTSAGSKTMEIEKGAITQSIAISANSIANGTTMTLDFSSLGIKVTVGDTYDVTTTNGAGAALTNTTTATNATFQLGNENNADNRISFSLTDLNLAVLANGSTADIAVDTLANAQAAIATIDLAIDTVATARASIGSVQNRMGFAGANIATSIENLTAAESIIRDADLAFETVAFTKNQILLQAGTAMLAQANAAPQSVLALLG
ncbi:MAG: flagellin N-terminal helical domain-containing protein [Candidatus Scalindua sp.]